MRFRLLVSKMKKAEKTRRRTTGGVFEGPGNGLIGVGQFYESYDRSEGHEACKDALSASEAIPRAINGIDQ